MVLRLVIGCSLVVGVSSDPVVITGATGQTGSATYKLLKAQGVEVRGLVRNVTKAKEVLGCTKCDATEGIFVGDVTKPDTLTDVMEGAGQLIILSGAGPICNPFPNCHYPDGGFPVDVDFHGGQNQVKAFVKGAGGKKPVILVSAEGTTEPDSQLDKIGNGQILFYKLNLEAFLMASGLPYTILKPCGLGNSAGGQNQLLVGHDDEEGWNSSIPIQRADVARVVANVVRKPADADGLRFDLCAKPGTPTPDADIPALLKAAHYPWQTTQVVV